MLASEVGNVTGLLAAAVVVFFLAASQGFAKRVAAMPNAHNTPEYATFRKLQVYEAAAVEALPCGGCDKERALQRRLQNRLGISAIEATAIESEFETPKVATAAIKFVGLRAMKNPKSAPYRDLI